jgi:Ser/Thr protein kinase RdoA (MazF antagonist)
MALNSYENRVWQIGIEEAPPLVAKFYRPGRWSDAQIAEEHAFTAEPWRPRNCPW